jgi:hypothetical protein
MLRKSALKVRDLTSVEKQNSILTRAFSRVNEGQSRSKVLGHYSLDNPNPLV